MSENAVQSNSPEAESEKTVVLLLPQALGDKVDSAQLYETLKSSKDVRVLLCLTDPVGDAAADARVDTLVDALKAAIAELKKAGRDVKVQVLLGPTVNEPNVGADVVLRAHASTSVHEPISVKDHTEFALALSDVVLLAPAFVALTSTTLPKELPEKLKKFLRTVEDLRKPKVKPGGPLPPLPTLADVTTRLDPERPGWFGRSRYYFWLGRLEQFVLELFAFDWCGWKAAWRSCKRLLNCLDAEWRPKSYAPADWEKFVPDGETRESSKIVACFSALDRSALYGSYKHRDFVWIAYLGAATAVLLAVAGHISDGGPEWAVVEFAVLLLVAALVLYARGTSLQDRWTACRLGAEQLRIALMSLPLLVLPEALATREEPSPSEKDDGSKPEVKFDFAALQQVKRAVRQHGLPRLDPKFTPEQAVDWTHRIIHDQISYHDRNHAKLERAESRLQIISFLIFASAMLAVMAHFFSHDPRLLLVTAAGPAFLAALHGAVTRLGIVHRAALSANVKRDLAEIDEALTKQIDPLRSEEERWEEVRQLAYRATETMGSENTSWHHLVRRYRDELP
jgi:hypothetical protein